MSNKKLKKRVEVKSYSEMSPALQNFLRRIWLKALKIKAIDAHLLARCFELSNPPIVHNFVGETIASLRIDESEVLELMIKNYLGITIAKKINGTKV